ncbi:MAG TPA: ComF family protein [Peptococcaceae bacterium]|nr:ComF family protein [Peptococcaceae bacterium]
MFDNLLPRLKQVTAQIWYKDEECCLLCGQKSGKAICRVCKEKYFLPELRRCPTCGKIIGKSKTHCQDCLSGKGPQGLQGVTALGHYEGAWKEFIHRIKFKGQPYLLLALAAELTAWAVKSLPPPDAVIPVPMHPNRLAQRGFNQAEVLASLLSRYLGIPYCNVLDRVVDTVPQSTLGRQARLENLQGAFSLQPGAKVTWQTVWLVDDVTTTGATLAECAAILHRNGVEKVYGFCLGAGKEG